MDKQTLKNALEEKTDCTIQHDGWCCGTCFFAIDESLSNEDWQALLLFRGDYNRAELNNLPKNEEASLKKILQLCK